VFVDVNEIVFDGVTDVVTVLDGVNVDEGVFVIVVDDVGVGVTEVVLVFEDVLVGDNIPDIDDVTDFVILIELVAVIVLVCDKEFKLDTDLVSVNGCVVAIGDKDLITVFETLLV
jgi:hypothetical protein